MTIYLAEYCRQGYGLLTHMCEETAKQPTIGVSSGNLTGTYLLLVVGTFWVLLAPDVPTSPLVLMLCHNTQIWMC